MSFGLSLLKSQRQSLKEMNPLVFYILLCIALFSIQSIAMKYIKINSIYQHFLVTGSYTLLIALSFWTILLVTHTNISFISWTLGILFGVFYIITISTYYFAMQSGPLTYANFFYSVSMAIPTIASLLFWKEPLYFTLIIAFVLLLISMYLICVSSKNEMKKSSGKWFLLCFISWFSNGVLSVIVKVQQTALQGKEAISIVAFGFSSACVLSLILYALISKKVRKNHVAQKDRHLIKSFMPFLLLVAIGNGGGNITATALASKVSGAYLFPSVMGGSMILVMIFAVTVLKEKTTVRGFLGIALGILAMVFLNI